MIASTPKSSPTSCAPISPPAYVYPAGQRPLRALLRQRLFFVWQRSDLLARIQSHQLAYNRTPVKQTRPNRAPWQAQLLAQEDDPLRQLALQNELAMIGHYDQSISALEEQLHQFLGRTPVLRGFILSSFSFITIRSGLFIRESHSGPPSFRKKPPLS